MKEYQKQVLKSKNSLDNFVDKIKTAVSGDAKATGHIQLDKSIGVYPCTCMCVCATVVNNVI